MSAPSAVGWPTAAPAAASQVLFLLSSKSGSGESREWGAKAAESSSASKKGWHLGLSSPGAFARVLEPQNTPKGVGAGGF